MGSANGDRSGSRRRKRRGEQALTSVDAGAMLREAREHLGIDLAEVHDRTGVSWRNLEALESGDVARFSDPSAAAVAMRRYAELVSLDPQLLIAALNNPPAYAYAGAPSSGTGVLRGKTASAQPSARHLRRFEDDHSHLRSFTQTAEVPAVRGVSGPPPISGTNGYAQVRIRRKAPWFLRFVTWLALFLLILGAAGLAVDHYEPQWLRDVHLIQSQGHQAGGTHDTTTSTSTVPTTQPPPKSPSITTTKTAKGQVTVDVGVANYTVDITTFGLCWIQASTPLSVNPILNRTLQPGQSVSIPVTGTQLTVELGSIAAEVKVQIGGQTVQGWSLKPDTVPYVLTFSAPS